MKVGQWAETLAGSMVLTSADMRVELRADNSAAC